MSVEYNGKTYDVYIGEKSKLITLNLMGLGIKDIADIKGLDEQKDLQKLLLNNNKIREIKGLDQLNNLKELYLTDNNIDKIQGLETLSNLSYLNLVKNPIYKWAKKNLGGTTYYGDFKDPQKFVKYCKEHNFEFIKKEIIQLGKAYQELSFKQISSNIDIPIGQIETIVQELIMNGEIKATIRGKDVIFKKKIDFVTSPKGYEKTSSPIKETEIKEGAIIFISYATKDAQLYNISEISSKLEASKEIGEVLYWQEDMHDSIIEYMNDNLGRCDVVLLFCSPNALESIPVKKEWMAAEAIQKPIIPIFFKTEHIPTLLSDRLGVEFDNFDFDKTIKVIHDLILKKIPR